MDDLFKVWSLPAIVGAYVVGHAFGHLVIARISSQPRWRTMNSARAYGWLVGVLSGWFGFFFYVSQIAAAFIQHDFQWERIMSRYGMWLVLSIGVGIGTAIGMRRAER